VIIIKVTALTYEAKTLKSQRKNPRLVSHRMRTFSVLNLNYIDEGGNSFT